MDTSIHEWLNLFGLDATLHSHALAVVTHMPEGVRQGLMNDPSFRMVVVEPTVSGTETPVGDLAHGRLRVVALKGHLRLREAAFARWVIAHELAHAHLCNQGRTPGEDPEAAADALAAEWGFARPVNWRWW